MSVPSFALNHTDAPTHPGAGRGGPASVKYTPFVRLNPENEISSPLIVAQDVYTVASEKSPSLSRSNAYSEAPAISRSP